MATSIAILGKGKFPKSRGFFHKNLAREMGTVTAGPRIVGGSFMRNGLRALSGLLALLAMWLMAGCSGTSVCPTVGFGTSTACTTGGSGGGSFGGGGGSGGGGGGGSSTTPTTFAYTVDEGGTIDGYVFSNSGGTFAAISSSTYTAPTIPANGGGVGMVVAQQQYLYAALADDNEIYGYTIGTNGALTAMSSSPFSAPYLSNYVSGVGQANMITNPLGTLLFVSDELGESIYVYTIGTGGILTEVSGSPFACPPGFIPMNLTTDGLGKYLYAVNGDYAAHQGSAIAAFSIGTSTNLGVLTAVTGSPFTGTGFNMWQLRGEPTGQFLIGTTGSTAASPYNGTDDENLYVFSIAQSSSSTPGAITTLSGSPFTTEFSPFSIAVQSNTDGNLVYSFSVSDAGALNPIEGYTISSAGALAADSGSPFNVANTNYTWEGTWGQFDQSGGYLFVYLSYYNSSDQLQAQLAPLAVAADGTLTEPADPVGLVTPGFWVVTDPQ
jgi:hypothetical protein